MKLLCMSDLHLEFDRQYRRLDENIRKIFDNYLEYDYIVLAGDIDIAPFIEETLWMISNISKKPIIYVPGNHEYYNSGKNEVDGILKNINIPDVHVLNRSIFITDGYAFIGATGWSDGSNGETPLKDQLSLNDFRLIRNENIFKWGDEDRNFFESSLKGLDNNGIKMICVSHNPPIPRLQRMNSADGFFRNDWEYMIYNFNPKAWICGHTHEYQDIEMNNCQIVNNPRGYYLHSENSLFNPKMIFEV